MTKSDSIGRRESGLPGREGRKSSLFGQSASALAKTKLQLIITAVISLLIGICIGIVAVHVLSGTGPGLEGQWRHYMRF